AEATEAGLPRHRVHRGHRRERGKKQADREVVERRRRQSHGIAEKLRSRRQRHRILTAERHRAIRGGIDIRLAGTPRHAHARERDWTNAEKIGYPDTKRVPAERQAQHLAHCLVVENTRRPRNQSGQGGGGIDGRGGPGCKESADRRRSRCWSWSRSRGRRGRRTRRWRRSRRRARPWCGSGTGRRGGSYDGVAAPAAAAAEGDREYCRGEQRLQYGSALIGFTHHRSPVGWERKVYLLSERS